MFMAFDLLHQDGVNLQKLALSERKRDLHRLCAKSRLRFLREAQTFPNGSFCSSTATNSGLRSGLQAARPAYVSGPSKPSG